MPCFFITSGFLFSLSYLDNAKRFVVRKFKSLWWPYAKWTLIFILFHNIFAKLGFHSSVYALPDICQHSIGALLMMWEEQMGGTFWFLKALLFASLLSFAWLKIFGSGIGSVLMYVVVLISANILLAKLRLSYYYLTDLNLLATVYFSVGILLKRICCYIDIIQMKIRYMLLFGLIVICFLVGMQFNTTIDMSNAYDVSTLPYLFVSMGISCSLILICMRIPIEYTIYISRIGNRSLDIMIFHFLAFKIVSLWIIMYYSHPISMMSKFPVISQGNQYTWILYSSIGIIGSLWIAMAIEYIRKSLKSVMSRAIRCVKNLYLSIAYPVNI